MRAASGSNPAGGARGCAILATLRRTSIPSRLIIRSSDIHAAGCFTLERVPKGTRLLEYEGERITKEEGDRRYDGRSFTYLFGLGKRGMVIDGHGVAMFVNHSCWPNCIASVINNERVYIIANRDIRPGEEITYDYALTANEDDDDAPCHCGSRKCRGSMLSPSELKKWKAQHAGSTKEVVRQMRRGRLLKGILGCLVIAMLVAKRSIGRSPIPNGKS